MSKIIGTQYMFPPLIFFVYMFLFVLFCYFFFTVSLGEIISWQEIITDLLLDYLQRNTE